MRDMWSVLVLVFALAGVSCAPKTSDGDANMQCVEHLVIPTFPPIAESARVAGTISVAVQLAQGGGVQSVSQEWISGQPKSPSLFFPQVEEFVRRSQFAKDCGGKTVRLILAFRLTTATEPDGRTLSFGYPNRFEIAVTPPLIDIKGEK